ELTVGDEEGVHGAHEDPEIPDSLRLIDESLEVIKKANLDQQMFYAHAIHSLIHPESIEIKSPLQGSIKAVQSGALREENFLVGSMLRKHAPTDQNLYQHQDE
ncbi:hypothetical protein Dimus_002821, partial [Dionaea muscipula]